MYEKRWKDMIDPSDVEQIAIDVAGQMGGAFLEEIKQTDMSRMTAQQWQDFIGVICAGYTQTLMQAEDAAIKAASKVKYLP